MKPSEVLRAARQLITPKEKWGQGYISERPNNTLCAYQALEVVTANARSGRDFWKANRILCQAMGMRETDFNDTHTHAQVLAAFDKAIALAEAEENWGDRAMNRAIAAVGLEVPR